MADRIAALVLAEVDFVPSPVDEMSLYEIAVARVERPPRELLRAVQTGKPLMLAEAPSSKVQARTDIGVSAWMALPILEGHHITGLLVLHRNGRPFGGDELATVLGALQSEVAHEALAIAPRLAAGGRGSR